jgi:tetratricopeptide (TPR) repeat protein
MRKLLPTIFAFVVLFGVAVVCGLLGIDLGAVFTTALKWLGLVLLASLVGFALFFFVRVRVLPPRYLADRSRAQAALSRGDFATADKIYARWWPTFPPRFVDALCGRARTLALQGELTRASELLEQELDKTMQPPGWLVAHLAGYYALAGRIEEAQRLLDKVFDHGALDADGEVLAAFARAVIDCRSGRHGDAARKLDDQWSAVEQRISGVELRPWRVLCAFAQTHGGTLPGGWSETVLASVRPAYPHEHAWLATCWPEMARFLEDKGIA